MSTGADEIAEPSPRLNARRLFNKLLPALGIDTVCDVGSMNGADALRFRASLPQARIFAFEANPQNFQLMQTSPILREKDIQLVPLAVTNCDGEGEFFVVEADYASINHQRGMSSLYRRQAGSDSLSAVPVKTTRLDTFLRHQSMPQLRLALWIDVEGSGYEVIEGAAGVIDNIHLLHVEVESSPCIAAAQRLYPEVRARLRSAGIEELATDRAPGMAQFNALFVRRDLPTAMQLQVRSHLALARLRFLVTSNVRKILGPEV